MTRSMSRGVVRGAGVAAVALLTTVATALPAHALNRTDCGHSTDFFEVHSAQAPGGVICFANAGEMNVAIYQVSHISTGNNVVRFRYKARPDTPVKEVGVGRWSSYSPHHYDPDVDYINVDKVEWIKIH